MNKIGTMQVYACGGAGINISKFFNQFASSTKNKGAYCDINTVFIDTSLANRDASLDDSSYYHIEGLDGSGKIRAQNYREISESVADILLKHQPADINIVISSLSGGSGATISPALISELLAKGQNVIVAGIGSTDSRIEIENTVKTLKSFEAIAKLREKPVALLYYENNETTKRQDVNTQVQGDIVSLAALFSRQHLELDSADLTNWMSYPKVTTVEPKLVALKFSNGPVQANKAHILTAATLAYEGMATALGSSVDYQCVGYVTKENEPNIALKEPLHFLLIDGIIIDVYNKYAKLLEGIDEVNRARKRTTAAIVSMNDNVQDDGLVL